MRRPPLARVVTASLLLATACAHGAASPPPPPEAVRWPEPPLAARVQLSAILVGGVQPSSRSWWRTALSVVTGAAPESEQRLTLVRPFDVAEGPSGALWVADPDGHRVLRFDAGGAFAGEITCAGRPWDAPMSVVAEGDGSILVADAGAAAVVRWTPAACRVLRHDGLQRPTGIAASGGRILVADPPAHQVIALSASGDELARWGERGDGAGQFQFPSDVAVGPDGSILVVDSLNFRIARLGPDGRWLGAFGAAGDAGAGFARPKGIAVDASGRVYVSDAQRDVVLVFGADGSLDFVLGASGSRPGRLAHPAGVSVVGERIAVADSLNQRIQVFERLGGTP